MWTREYTLWVEHRHPASLKTLMSLLRFLLSLYLSPSPSPGLGSPTLDSAPSTRKPFRQFPYVPLTFRLRVRWMGRRQYPYSLGLWKGVTLSDTTRGSRVEGVVDVSDVGFGSWEGEGLWSHYTFMEGLTGCVGPPISCELLFVVPGGEVSRTRGPPVGTGCLGPVMGSVHQRFEPGPRRKGRS